MNAERVIRVVLNRRRNGPTPIAILRRRSRPLESTSVGESPSQEVVGSLDERIAESPRFFTSCLLTCRRHHCNARNERAARRLGRTTVRTQPDCGMRPTTIVDITTRRSSPLLHRDSGAPLACGTQPESPRDAGKGTVSKSAANERTHRALDSRSLGPTQLAVDAWAESKVRTGSLDNPSVAKKRPAP
jgi:hypothetical protein